MKSYRVPIFTEEYAVQIFIGTKKDCIKAAAKYAKQSSWPQPEWWFEDQFGGRGHVFKIQDLQPMILVDGDLPAHIAIATLAHEACHAADYIQEYITMDERRGEFRAHAVAAIMRAVVGDLIPVPKKPKQ